MQAQREDQEFKINPDDLQGFWDMVTIQVEEVHGAFNDLDVLQQNNWTAVDEETSSEQVNSISLDCPYITVILIMHFSSRHHHVNRPVPLQSIIATLHDLYLN